MVATSDMKTRRIEFATLKRRKTTVLINENPSLFTIQISTQGYKININTNTTFPPLHTC